MSKFQVCFTAETFTEDIIASNVAASADEKIQKNMFTIFCLVRWKYQFVGNVAEKRLGCFARSNMLHSSFKRLCVSTEVIRGGPILLKQKIKS